MKIRYLDKKAIRKTKRAERRLQRKQEYKARIAKWHPKFVIWPRKLHTPNDDAQYATRAFFERIWQKGRIVNNIGPDTYDTVVWMRLTEKDYFLQKLDGTLPLEEKFNEFSPDGTAMNMGASMASSPQSFSSSK